MLVIQDQAVTKVCPFISQHETSNVSPLCRASLCMAWRFGKRPLARTIDHPMSDQERAKIMDQDLPDPPRPEGVPESYVFTLSRHKSCWVEDENSVNARRKGYCSLMTLPKERP